MATITSGQTFSGQVGVPFTGSVVASGFGTVRNWQATGLPSGVTINSTTGVISGTPVENGNMTISVGGDESAYNFVQSGSSIIGDSGDLLGGGVAINSSGTRIAVGAVANDAFGSDAGCIRIYDFDGAGWVKVGADLGPGKTASFNGSGDIVAIGSDWANSQAGKVKIYQLQGGVWVQMGNDFNGVYPSASYMGGAVKLNSTGDRIAISNAVRASAAPARLALYDWDGNTWNLTGEIYSTGSGIDIGGVSMNAAGTRVVVGEPKTVSNAGVVRVFDLINGSWSRVGSILTGANYNYFGGSVSMNAAGDRFVVGSSGESSTRGNVKIYQWAGSDWSLLGSSISDKANAGTGGSISSVSMNAVGDLIAIGEALNDGVATDAGIVRLFRWNNTSWVQFLSDFNGSAANDRFGSAVALNSSGNKLIAGGMQLNSVDWKGYAKVYSATGAEVSLGFVSATNFFNVTGIALSPPSQSNTLKAYFGNTLILDTRSASSYKSSDGYTRPSDWLSILPPVANEVRALHAVFNQTENYCTVFGRTTDASSWFVDWGDGTVDSVVSNTTASHNYAFNAAALDGTLTSKGYKQVRVKIYPQAGKTFYAVWFNQKVSTPSGLQIYSSGWLDMNVNLPNLAAGGNLQWGTNVIRHSYLERVNITSWGNINSLNNMFNGCHALQSLNEHEWNTSQITSMNSTFFNCQRIQQLDCSGWNMSNVTDITNLFRYTTAIRRIALSNWDVSKVTNMTSTFQDSQGIQDIDVSNWNTASLVTATNTFRTCLGLKILNVKNWNMSKATNINSMFNSCASVQEIDISLWSLPLCTNAGDLFNACVSLKKIEACNFSASTTFGTTFAVGCNSLTSVTITGINASIHFTNGMMSASALNTLYGNLTTTATAKTITVTGNYGTTTDTPSIATAKGWTVVPA